MFALIISSFLLAVGVGFFVFVKPIESALQTQLNVIGSEEEINVMELDPGRFRIASQHPPKRAIHIKLDCPSDARFLMIRKGHDFLTNESVGKLKVSISEHEPIIIRGHSFKFSKRYFIPIITGEPSISVRIESLDNEMRSLVIDEVGLYKSDILSKGSSKRILKGLFGVLFLIGVLGCISHAFMRKRQAATLGAAFIFIFSVLLHFTVLLFLFSPEWARDLKVHFASGALQEGRGTNLNYGMYMASSILQGKGPLIGEVPPWCRMPGYGFFMALSGNAQNLVQMAVNGVFIHITFFATSLTFFFWSALRIIPPTVAAFTSLLIMCLPWTFYNLQIETLMPAVILLCMGASCLFIGQYEKSKRVPLGFHILLHLTVAFWFIMRTDILPAWGIVSIILYVKNVRSWKYFLIPISLILLIGLPWAFFKMPFTEEFSMTTESVGASLMGGLWEVPHKFIWGPTDGSVFRWMEMQNEPPCTKRISDLAFKEGIRFCLTYPFYTLSLIWHKFLIFAKLPIGYKGIGFHWQKLTGLFIILLALIVGYETIPLIS